MDYVKRPRTTLELHLDQRFDWQAWKFAMLIMGPGIVLHELGHKFVALAFGLAATFKMWVTGLVIGLILKFMHSPLLILAPGYVEISGGTHPAQAIIAFAGPAVNLLIWGISASILKTKKKLGRKEFIIWAVTKNMNLFLFIFNMLPIPPLDGSKVFYHLWKAFF